MAKAVVCCFTIALIAVLVVIGVAVENIDAKLTAALDAFGLFLWALGIIIIVALALGTIIILYALWSKHVTRQRRPIDGAFPIQIYRLRKWREDLPWELAIFYWLIGEKMIVNPNTLVASAAIIDPRRGLVELEPMAGWSNQVAVRLAVEATNRVRAAFPGDDARMDRHGHMSDSPRMGAGGWRVLSQDKPQLPAPKDEVEGTFTPVVIPFGDAVRSNSKTAFALGQSPNGIVRWDVEQAPHIRVHGQTQGSGKTNLIKTIIAGAILQGAHVIVLDRRGFKDWSDYRRHVEFVDNRKPGVFASTLQQLCEIYRERDVLLGQYGAGNLGELPDAPARLFVVVSEFGTACREAATTGELDEALPVLKSIMSEAGATGVHLIFEDQVVNRNWPRELRGNADPVTGYLPEDTAAAGGYRRAFDLKPHEFHYDGQRFQTWDMRSEAPRLLATVTPTGECVIDIRSVVRCSVENNNSVPKLSENNNQTEHRTPNAELRQMVWAWRDAHPQGTQAELRKSFEQDGIEIARGYVHECWHKWPGAQPSTAADQLQALGFSLADVRLRNGDKFGIDTTHGG